MHTPVVTEPMPIGIVVRDLDAALRHSGDDYGIGPWQVTKVTAGYAQELRVYGSPATYACGVAFAMIGHVPWDLIAPRDEDSLFARFRAEKGGSVHQLADATPNVDATLAREAKRGTALVLSGTFSGVPVVYLATERDFGMLREVVSGSPQVDAS